MGADAIAIFPVVVVVHVDGAIGISVMLPELPAVNWLVIVAILSEPETRTIFVVGPIVSADVIGVVELNCCKPPTANNPETVNAVADKVPVLGTYDNDVLLYVGWLVPGDTDPINENCG